MKHGQIRPLYLEPRLHKQSVYNIAWAHFASRFYDFSIGFFLCYITMWVKKDQICFMYNIYIYQEFLKFVGPLDRRGQIFGRSDRSLILGQ
jgi:hypothetical protein